MEAVLEIIANIKRETSAFYGSGVFALIKFIVGIYVSVLLIDIILMLFQRGIGGDIRDTVLGVDIPKELVSKKKKLSSDWDKIMARLESGNESEYKVAIIEADNLIEDLVTRLGYKGSDTREKLESIPEGQIENIDRIKEAHEVRNRVIHEDDFSLSKEEARKVLEDFSELLRFFQVID